MLRDLPEAVLLFVRIAFYKDEEVIRKLEISHIVDEVVLVALPRPVNVGVKVKVIAFRKQFVAVQCDFAFGIQLSQDAPVFTQRMIDVAHQVTRITVVFIVEAVAALVRTETFINPPENGFATLCAFSFHTFF